MDANVNTNITTELCIPYINNGMILRYVITVIIFYLLSKEIYGTKTPNKSIQKYIYLVIPICLILLDQLDGIFMFFENCAKKYCGCKKIFEYQLSDKICDSISYLLVYHFFGIDTTFLLFVLYRIIGVLLFYLTKNSQSLIVFFDFAKEYILYLFFFGEIGKTYTHLIIFIILKIVFEFYHHTYINPNNYT